MLKSVFVRMLGLVVLVLLARTAAGEVAAPNQMPVAKLTAGAPGATVPYLANVSLAGTADADGFLTWATLNWGDGTIIALTLPPQGALTHTYTVPGNITITLTVIDNGKMPAGTKLSPVPAVNNPEAALAAAVQQQLDLIDAGTLDKSFSSRAYLPQLAKAFVYFNIPGKLTAKKGSFKASLVSPGSDSLSLTFAMATPVPGVANATADITLGVGANALVLTQITGDASGKAYDPSQGVAYQMNTSKGVMTFKLSNATLQTLLNLSATKIVNGSANLPFQVVLNKGTAQATTLATTIHFAYKTKNAKSATGKVVPN